MGRAAATVVLLQPRRYWTEAFANPNSAAPEEKITMIVEMGFERAAAIKALQEAGGDENAALEKLLGQ
jgi:ubiquitin-conjugating enzyme (huntingtin interacting protein 2)